MSLHKTTIGGRYHYNPLSQIRKLNLVCWSGRFKFTQPVSSGAGIVTQAMWLQRPSCKTASHLSNTDNLLLKAILVSGMHFHHAIVT